MFKITKYVCLALWGLFILGLLIGGGVLWAISNGYIGEMPSIEELENPQSKYATIVYSADSVELGRFSRAKENRVFINYNELSPNLINALVATEDARFLDHSGIDIRFCSTSVRQVAAPPSPSSLPSRSIPRRWLRTSGSVLCRNPSNGSLP